MKIIEPKIPNELTLVQGFSSYVQSYLQEEMSVSSVRCEAQQAEKGDFYQLELRSSVLEGCMFQNGCFEKAGFIDVVFQSCDFSNSSFASAYFERCRFLNCKCIGADFRESVFKQTLFSHTQLHYACFDQSKLTDVFFDGVDFTEASVSQCVLKRVQAKETRFIKNNFFKTMLLGMDFTQNELLAPIVSSPPLELKGAVINPLQAADLIGLWGIVVK